MVFLVAAVILDEVPRHLRRGASQVDINAPGVCFGGEGEAKFAADLFDTRFELLDVVDGVDAFAHDPLRYRGISCSSQGEMRATTELTRGDVSGRAIERI